MSAILTTFGIDWHLLLINAINFGLLLAGLTYFLYKPILKMLDERRQKVAEGVEAAHQAEVRLSEIEASREGRLAAAGKEADGLVAAARASGVAKEREIVGDAEQNAAQIVKEAHAQAAELKAQALQESKQEVAKLIVLGIEKSMAK